MCACMYICLYVRHGLFTRINKYYLQPYVLTFCLHIRSFIKFDISTTDLNDFLNHNLFSRIIFLFEVKKRCGHYINASML